MMFGQLVARFKRSTKLEDLVVTAGALCCCERLTPWQEGDSLIHQNYSSLVDLHLIIENCTLPNKSIVFEKNLQSLVRVLRRQCGNEAMTHLLQTLPLGEDNLPDLWGNLFDLYWEQRISQQVCHNHAVEEVSMVAQYQLQAISTSLMEPIEVEDGIAVQDEVRVSAGTHKDIGAEDMRLAELADTVEIQGISVAFRG